jgi:outer membrane protein TolC
MRLRRLLLFLAVGLQASCMVGPDFKVPKAEVEKQWLERKAVSGKPYGSPEIFWWRNFNDPVLTRLVELAYDNNLSLQVAEVRLLQVRAALNHSIGNLRHPDLSGKRMT